MGKTGQNPFEKLNRIGQSIWYDNIQRRLLENGTMAEMIRKGEIRGVTSNPSIFYNAIAKSTDYDAVLIPMAWSGWDAKTIFWQLAIDDICQACELFLPLYQETGGADGFVSLELLPELAHNTAASIAQTRDLWSRVGQPNLMIKVPATKEGLPVIHDGIAAGININITLIFSIERYREVMEAYLSGLEDRLKAGGDISKIASVASFFVSRMDTKVDALLPEGSPLRGKSAIANAKLAYVAFQETFAGERWEKLVKAGARLQRPLWASTSTKNPAYPDTMYVENLIGNHTVDTVPPQTLDAIRDHGKIAETISLDVDQAQADLAALEAAGISVAQDTLELEQEGVKTFGDAYVKLIGTIDERRAAAVRDLGVLANAVGHRVASLESEHIPDRVWEGDASVWSTVVADEDEIRRRMGWLTLPEASQDLIKGLDSFARQVWKEGIHKFLLLGMGGSSLCAEVIDRVSTALNTEAERSDKFAILDSTDPAQVAQAAKDFPPAESLYIVSSKSGGTAEVNAALAYFWKLSGEDGQRFIAITDPGTSLDSLANARGFRHIFHGDPTVGGRFSVLSVFGLVPAALMGVDLSGLLNSSARMMDLCGQGHDAARNPGLVLGTVLGEAALAGKDKLTIIADEPLSSFGSWLEQLIMESSGKQGRGVAVVDLEPELPIEKYGSDRMFIYLRKDGKQAARAEALKSAGHPVLEYAILDVPSLGAEFYRWEFATSILCAVIGVNAFDQPEVQDSKDRTKNLLNAHSQYLYPPDTQLRYKDEHIKIYSSLPASGTLAAAILDSLLPSAKSYLALQAYLPRTPEMLAALTRLRMAAGMRVKCATTLGFGPRFLHSTGQYHKGGPAGGLYLQITADPKNDLEVPGQGLTFGHLEAAQALGDYDALQARGRNVIRVHLSSPDAVDLLTGILSG